MPPQSISTLMVDADFGRILSSRELLLARSYRWLLFTLITALLIAHLPLTNSAAPIFVGLATLLAYITVRSRLSPRMEGYFYTPRPQLQFALFTVLGVTGMLVLLGLKGSEGVLWILYLPALLLVSFYARQSTYFVMVALVATMAAGTRYIELRNTSLPINPYGIPDTLVMACELFIRACAVVLASFLVHYLARVDLTVNYGSELRKKITHNLLQRILLETNGLALWGEIHKACDASTKADHSDLYLYDQEQQQLQEVKQGAHGGYVLGRIIDMTSDDIAARVIQSKEVIVIREKKPIGLAAPIYGPLGRDSNPLAVIILYINFSSERECLVTLSWLIDMLNDIQPIVTYATIYQQSLLPDSTDNDENYSLHLEEVLDRVVKTLCYKFGFSLAKISLFNEGRQELRAICSNGMQKGFGTDTRDWKE
ncbi:MAG TPA: hypothetical protein VLA19_10910, partial [Herpetosiphonaceae bacterium]|nr:hypothetical protein [Herpetosiphonaceae bacterium]